MYGNDRIAYLSKTHIFIYGIASSSKILNFSKYNFSNSLNLNVIKILGLEKIMYDSYFK